jgi:hypothetical protein
MTLPRLWLPIATGLLAVALAHAQPAAPSVAASAPAAVASATPAASAGTTAAQPARPVTSARAPARTASVRQPPAPRPEASPTWAELTPQQQQSLGPLAGTWRVLGEAHKRKWLALSENYPTMQPAEQALLHSRMTEWAALSPQQRTLARLNFAEAQKVAPQDKRAKWEAYQALPPEEKRKLAAGAAATAKPPPTTAIAVHPVPQQKLAHIPRRKPGNAARIAVLPGQVDNNTLLPQPLAPVQP